MSPSYAHLFGGSLATVATGWLMARPVMADSRRIMWLLGAGTPSPRSPPASLYYTHDLAVAKAMFWIFIPAIYFYIGPCFGLMNNLAQCRMRAMFCAMTLFLANVGNLLITPTADRRAQRLFRAHRPLASRRAAPGDAVHRAHRALGRAALPARRQGHRKDQVRARTFPF